MAQPTLLPDPTPLHLKLLDGSSKAIIDVVMTTSLKAACPLCQAYSDRVHSRYVRQVADLPWMGCAVRLELHVRRFFCSNLECSRQIFTERLPSVVAPYARRTTRLSDVFTLIGFALGGEAGQRLVAGMVVPQQADGYPAKRARHYAGATRTGDRRDPRGHRRGQNIAQNSCHLVAHAVGRADLW